MPFLFYLLETSLLLRFCKSMGFKIMSDLSDGHEWCNVYKLFVDFQESKQEIYSKRIKEYHNWSYS